jgi:hypothetical protein
MRRYIKTELLIIILLTIVLLIFRIRIQNIFYPSATGAAIDSLNGVKVYYNGAVGNVLGRHTAADGYNLGLKYQCVEFVKRYYYEYYHHKMPDSYGHAVSFYEPGREDSTYIAKRDLLQFNNPGSHKPRTGDLLVYSGTGGNPYGHVAIVSQVQETDIEIIQQNPGIGAPSRIRIDLEKKNDQFRICNDRILGWLRKNKF